MSDIDARTRSVDQFRTQLLMRPVNEFHVELGWVSIVLDESVSIIISTGLSSSTYQLSEILGAIKVSVNNVPMKQQPTNPAEK